MDWLNQILQEVNWIAGAIEKPGALHRQLGVPEGEKIPVEKLQGIKSRLSKKAEEGKLPAGESKELKRVNLALTLGKLHKK